MTERGRGSNCKHRAERKDMIRLANEITRQEENIDIRGKIGWFKNGLEGM